MCRPPENRGPQVAAGEDLFRMVPADYVKDGLVSTGAFTYKDCFSVEIVSRTAGPADSLSRVPQACAVIRFNCGCARMHGALDARDERDETHPENLAHAHVYTSTERRKTLAKEFVTRCRPQIVLNICGPAGG